MILYEIMSLRYQAGKTREWRRENVDLGRVFLVGWLGFLCFGWLGFCGFLFGWFVLVFDSIGKEPLVRFHFQMCFIFSPWGPGPAPRMFLELFRSYSRATGSRGPCLIKGVR